MPKLPDVAPLNELIPPAMFCWWMGVLDVFASAINGYTVLTGTDWLSLKLGNINSATIHLLPYFLVGPIVLTQPIT